MERRRQGRLPFETRIDLHYEEIEAFASGYTTNLSGGGVFVALAVQPPAGTILTFNLKSEHGECLVRGRGKVIWIRKEDDGDDRPAGIAVRFLELVEEGKPRLDQLLDQIGPPPEPLLPADEANADRVLLFDLGVTDEELDRSSFFTQWSGEVPGPAFDPAGTSTTPAQQNAKPEPQLLLPEPEPMSRQPAAVRAGLVEPPPPPAEPRPRRRLTSIVAWLVFLLLAVAGVATVFIVPQIWGPPSTWLERLLPGVSTVTTSATATPGTEPQQTPPAGEHQTATPGTAGQQPQPTRPSQPVATSRPVGNQATRVLDVAAEHRGGTTTVTIIADGPLSPQAVRHFSMDNPPRIVFHIKGISQEYHRYRVEPSSPLLHSIRFGLHLDLRPPELSVVLDLADARVAVQEVDVTGTMLTIRLGKPSGAGR